jgi:hypothetical protein
VPALTGLGHVAGLWHQKPYGGKADEATRITGDTKRSVEGVLLT